jgi:asparagine synthetase B (glutamine-hydrolysing)
MCGIAGIIGRVAPPNRDALRRMSRAMAHRDPDGDGYWVASPDDRGWGVMLAHRRLSILDLSPTGAQPMVDWVTGSSPRKSVWWVKWSNLRDVRLIRVRNRSQLADDVGF